MAVKRKISSIEAALHEKGHDTNFSTLIEGFFFITDKREDGMKFSLSLLTSGDPNKKCINYICVKVKIVGSKMLKPIGRVRYRKEPNLRMLEC